jgi:uncharacterized membrane protein affecting hemolysin expression
MSALTSICGFLRVVLTTHLAAFRDARTAGDRGASAVELAIITAVIIVIAGVILAAINLFVTNESNKISTNG